MLTNDGFKALIPGVVIEDIFVDYLDDDTWIATSGYGLARIGGDDDKIDWFRSNKGLPSDYVLRVCQIDRQPERVWAGTRNGLAISEDEGNSWTRVQELMNRKILAIEGFEDGIVVGTNSGAFFGVENNWSELPGTQGVRINSVSTIQNRLLIAKNDGVLVYPLKDSFGANELPFDSPFLIPSDALMINGPGLVLDVRDFTTELELYVRSSGDGDRRFDAHALEQLGIVQ